MTCNITPMSVDELASVIFRICPGDWHHLVDDPSDHARDVAVMLKRAMPKLKQSYPDQHDFMRQCESFSLRHLRMGGTWKVNGIEYHLREKRTVVRDWLEQQGIKPPSDGKTLRISENDALAFKMRWG